MSCPIKAARRLEVLPGYHPATCGPNGVHLGKRWQDMPGNGEDMKRMNFRLFVRGLHTGETSPQAKERAIRAMMRLKPRQ